VTYWAQIFDGGEPRAAVRSARLEMVFASVSLGLHEDTRINLSTKQNTDVTLHGEITVEDLDFAIDTVYNVNGGWDKVGVTIDKKNLTYTSSDPGVVQVGTDGVIKPLAEGSAQIYVAMKNFPARGVTYNVTVSGHRYGDGVVFREPTFDTEGEMRYLCLTQGCNGYYTEPIPMLSGPLTEVTTAAPVPAETAKPETAPVTETETEKAVTEAPPPQTEPATEADIPPQEVTETTEAVTETEKPDETTAAVTETAPADEGDGTDDSGKSARLKLLLILLIILIILILLARSIYKAVRENNRNKKKKK
jgi:Predicted membrane protein